MTRSTIVMTPELVGDRDVTRTEPAALEKRGVGRIRESPVPAHHVGTGDDNLTWFAGGSGHPVIANETHVCEEVGNPGSSDGLAAEARIDDERTGRSLGHPVALDEREPALEVRGDE